MADTKELDSIDEKSKLNDGDAAKIKFQPSKNGEAKIEIPDASIGYQCGLTKEELMKYANDPFWIALRRVLFVLFWALWLLMLVGAVAIIIMTPKCAAPKQPEWYESSPIYTIRVDEFSDGDGDQKSDLKGINEKLPYLAEISISAVALEGMINTNEPTVIKTELGTIEDFEQLAGKIKTIIKVPVDRFNLQDKADRDIFNDMLKFWLDKGAAGFVFDNVERLVQGEKVEDFMDDWHHVIHNASTEEFPRVSIISNYNTMDEQNMIEMCPKTNMVLNYGLINLEKSFTAEQFLSAFEHTVANRTHSCRSNIVLGDGDIVPMVDRFTGAERDRIVMFSLMSDATPFIYFGDEYGKADNSSRTNSPVYEHKRRTEDARVEPMDWKLLEDMKTQTGNNFYKVFKQSAELRHKEYAVKRGDTVLKMLGDDVVAMSRVKKGNPAFVVVTSFKTDNSTVVNLSDLGGHIPEGGHADVVSSNSEQKLKTKLNLKELNVSAGETIILQFVPILS